MTTEVGRRRQQRTRKWIDVDDVGNAYRVVEPFSSTSPGPFSVEVRLMTAGMPPGTLIVRVGLVEVFEAELAIASLEIVGSRTTPITTQRLRSLRLTRLRAIAIVALEGDRDRAVAALRRYVGSQSLRPAQ